MQIINRNWALCFIFKSQFLKLQIARSLLFCEDEQQGVISSADGIFWDMGQTPEGLESAGRGQWWVGGQQGGRAVAMGMEAPRRVLEA